MNPSRRFGKRTKIVCTLGPASGSAEIIEKLIAAGMNAARLNLSHGTAQEHDAYISRVRDASARLGVNVALIIDLPGPKYRTGKLRGGTAVLRKGAGFLFTTEKVEGDETRVSLNLPGLTDAVKAGDRVLLADGAIQLRVVRADAGGVLCRVLVGGVLTENRGFVVPGMRQTVPFVTDALRRALDFAVSRQPDYIALSFVSSAEDVASVKRLLGKAGADIPLISKIERGEAVKNFDGILAASDGIMVARGDLGVEIPLERVPLVQKDIIRKCNRAGKPVITATEMLASMVRSARPTRAETTDVANAIFDGTDATMLSEETSVGEHPLLAVSMMDRIARATEKKLPFDLELAERRNWFAQKTEELIGYNACVTADSLNAVAIVAFTESGSTAMRVSKYRPRTAILGITPDEGVCRRLALYWGVHPVRVDTPGSVAELFSGAPTLAKKLGLAEAGDLVVITGGIPLGQKGTTNLLKVETVT